MGVDDGGLLEEYLHGMANIEAIIDLYRDYQIYYPEVLQTPYLVFFNQDMDAEYSFDLSGEHLDKILERESEEDFSVKSESFEKLLFQAAFQQFERFSFRYKIEFSVSKYDMENTMKNHKIENRGEILAEIERIAEKNHLNKAWFSDMVYHIMLDTDLSFGIRMSETRGAGGFVAGEVSKIVEQEEARRKLQWQQ